MRWNVLNEIPDHIYLKCHFPVTFAPPNTVEEV